ncbi:MAG: hypothetical protein ABJZ55_01610 [Fuerstiella sp.]
MLTITKDVMTGTIMMFMTTITWRNLACLAAVFAATLFVEKSSARADDWGKVTGRITVAGDVPKIAALQITHDEEFCGQFKLTDHSLQVSAKNQGLANVVIWLSTKEQIPVHQSRQDISRPVMMDNQNCLFVPRVLPLRAGQFLHVTNSDSIPHNVSIYARRNLPVNLQVPDHEPLKKSFAKPELLPVRVDCSSHAWMRAYLVITDHGCVAVTDENGRFEIPNVPYGEWEFRMWHERPGYLNEITVDGTPKTLKRGTLKIAVDETTLQVGQIQVDAVHFEEE